MQQIRNLNASIKALLLVLVAGAGLAFMADRPRTDFNVQNVSVAEAKAMIEAGALVVDVRGEGAFNNRHIPGAISLPLAALRLGIPTSFSYAKDQPVVVYCGDGVTIGPEGTELLNKAGYAKAVNMESGIQGWTAAGLDVERN